MVQLVINIENDVLHSVMLSAKTANLDLDEYIKLKLSEPLSSDANADTPSLNDAFTVSLEDLALELYYYGVRHALPDSPLRVETMCKTVHPALWSAMSIGSRKALGRVFGQLVDTSYGEGLVVGGTNIWLTRHGKDSQNKMLYVRAEAEVV